MRLTLGKYHGLGNDFLVLANPPAVDLPALARRVCDRRRGIGADGLLTVEAASGYDARMTLYNADGSRAEMSGNGIRCFAQSIARHRVSLDPLDILTDAGHRRVELWATEDDTTLLASVSMGAASALPEPNGWDALRIAPGRPVLHLSLGNPHSVVATDDVFAVDLAEAGGLVPQINLELIQPGPEPDAITMRVHERGAGITEACGTGATAAAFAAAKWGFVAANTHEITVHMDGGDAMVRLGTELTLIGPTTFIATVTVEV
jgi:diaminopimelate epimerase